MGVLQVPSHTVFSAVLRLCGRIEYDTLGEATVSATLLSSWVRELKDNLPVPEVGEFYDPGPEWDDQDRFAALYLVLREMQQTSAPADQSRVLNWAFRLEAIVQCRKEHLEQIRHEILRETIH